MTISFPFASKSLLPFPPKYLAPEVKNFGGYFIYEENFYIYPAALSAAFSFPYFLFLNITAPRPSNKSVAGSGIVAIKPCS